MNGVWARVSFLLILFGSVLVSAADLKLIRGGAFELPYKKKRVTVPTFLIDETFVTNGEFEEFVKKNPSWQKGAPKEIFVDVNYLKNWASAARAGDSDIKSSPVVYVSWFAARAYCESRGRRLPTVYEWEYLSQFGPKGENGKDKDAVKRTILQWYSKPNAEKMPPVRSTFENEFGVWDVHGLAWSWNEDFNTAFVTGESRGDSALEKSMYCGAGSVNATDPNDYASFMRFGFRSSLQANYSVSNLGFRCAKDIK